MFDRLANPLRVALGSVRRAEHEGYTLVDDCGDLTVAKREGKERHGAIARQSRGEHEGSGSNRSTLATQAMAQKIRQPRQVLRSHASLNVTSSREVLRSGAGA